MPFANLPDNIWCAAREGRLSDVQRFVTLGVDVNARDQGRETPLHYAVRHGHLPTAQWLLAHKANVNARTAPVRGERHGTTPLHEAILSSQDVCMVDLLLEHDADVDVKMSDGSTAALLAAGEGQRDILRSLVHKGANLALQDQMKNIPFTAALAGNHLEIAKYLLEQGADVNHKTEPFGMSPLMCAALDKKLDQVEFLMKSGADINVQDDRGQTAMHHAVIGGAVRVTKTEWTGKAVKVTEDKPEHAIKIITLLLGANADYTVRDKEGMTPLDWAMKAHAQDLVKLFGV